MLTINDMAAPCSQQLAILLAMLLCKSKVVGDIPLGGILDMAKSGYPCWIGLGGPCSSQVDKADASRPKYGSTGAQTTKAVETYLADTLGLCRLARYVLAM